LIYLPLLLTVFYRPRERWHDRSSLFYFGLIFLQTLIIIYAGGDHFFAYRFFIPILPFLMIVSLKDVSNKLRPSQERVVYFLFFMALIFMQNQGAFFKQTGYKSYIFEGRSAAHEFATAGQWLKENTPEETVIATPVAGSLAYYSQRPSIDMLGLTDS